MLLLLLLFCSFTASEISSNLSYNPEWGTPSLPKEILFDQKYIFLSEGAQAYAFESEDHRYVIKFFKMKKFIPSWTDYLCPKIVQRKAKNLHWVFNGYKLAFEELKEDSGLVYIHLNKTNDLRKNLLVLDKEGKEHLIDLDQTEFVVQEKAELIFSYLKRQKEPQKAINAILELVRRREQKGLADRDRAVTNNFGFVGDRPIHLDVGRLYRGKKESQVERIERRIKREINI